MLLKRVLYLYTQIMIRETRYCLYIHNWTWSEHQQIHMTNFFTPNKNINNGKKTLLFLMFTIFKYVCFWVFVGKRGILGSFKHSFNDFWVSEWVLNEIHEWFAFLSPSFIKTFVLTLCTMTLCIPSSSASVLKISFYASSTAYAN